MGRVRLRSGNICIPYKIWQSAQSMRLEIIDTLDITERFQPGLTKGVQDLTMEDYLIEEFVKGVSKGIGDLAMEGYLIEDVSFTNV